jgi:hypothetical protein
MTDTAAVIAYNFYETKDPAKLLAEAAAEKVAVEVIESKDGSTSYKIGDSWLAVIYTPVGKKPAVTIRPILTA